LVGGVFGVVLVGVEGLPDGLEEEDEEEEEPPPEASTTEAGAMALVGCWTVVGRRRTDFLVAFRVVRPPC
jgi:hypothetical protein